MRLRFACKNWGRLRFSSFFLVLVNHFCEVLPLRWRVRVLLALVELLLERFARRHRTARSLQVPGLRQLAHLVTGVLLQHFKYERVITSSAHHLRSSSLARKGGVKRTASLWEPFSWSPSSR